MKPKISYFIGSNQNIGSNNNVGSNNNYDAFGEAECKSIIISFI